MQSGKSSENYARKTLLWLREPYAKRSESSVKTARRVLLCMNWWWSLRISQKMNRYDFVVIISHKIGLNSAHRFRINDKNGQHFNKRRKQITYSPIDHCHRSRQILESPSQTRTDLLATSRSFWQGHNRPDSDPDLLIASSWWGEWGQTCCDCHTSFIPLECEER